MSFLKRVRELLKVYLKYVLPVYILRTENKTITIIYAGYSKQKKKYFSEFIFGDKPYNSKFIGIFWYSSVNKSRILRKFYPDVIITEINRDNIQYFLNQDGYVIPEWINSVIIRIDEPIDIMKKKPDSHIEDVERLIRKFKLDYSISTSRNDLDYFFYKMHLPYVQKMFPDMLIPSTYKEYSNALDSSFIIFISQSDEERVGGGYISVEGDKARFRILGIKNGDPGYLRKGVIGALYYFAISECQKLGLKVIDIQLTRPFMKDGLTTYKRHMNGEFVMEYCPTIDHLNISFSRDSEYAKKFLKENPFVYIDADYIMNIRHD